MMSPPERPAWWPENENWPPRRAQWRRRRPRPWPFGFAPLLLLIGIAIVLGHYSNGWIIVLVLLGVLVGVIAALVRARRSAAAARRGLRAAESEGAQRKNFLADVTHELRTPLAVIRGQVEAISDGVYPPDAEHLQPIVDATTSLERLVDDLRTLSLSEAGQLELQREPLDLAELAADVVTTFRSQADAAHVALTSHGAAPAVDGDAVRLRGVLSNLVTNSLKHTPAGGHISITVAPRSDGASITVKDDGVGIPADLQPRVFDRFVKGDGSMGTGLGLAIARDVIKAHGGEIFLTSPPGTTIELVIPGQPG